MQIVGRCLRLNGELYARCIYWCPLSPRRLPPPRGRTTHPASRGLFAFPFAAMEIPPATNKGATLYFSDEYDGTADTAQLVPGWTLSPDGDGPWEDDYSDRSWA